VLVKRYGFATGKEDRRRYSPTKYLGALMALFLAILTLSMFTPAI
jgi:hypothetical protein